MQTRIIAGQNSGCWHLWERESFWRIVQWRFTGNFVTLISFTVDGSCGSTNKYNQPTLTASPIITSVTKCSVSHNKNIIYERLRLSYELRDTFLPHVLKKGVFTILAKNNIDKNASSKFAKSQYHDINISVIQFPTQGEMGSELPAAPISGHDSSSRKLALLPENYTYVEKLPFWPPKCTLFPPLSNKIK